jgi:DNA-binding NtrC family response regulator
MSDEDQRAVLRGDDEEDRISEYDVSEHEKTLLVLDDDPGVLRLVSRILTRRGHTILSASSAEGALAIGDSSCRIDLLLADMVMPSMLGSEVAARLKRTRPGMRVILMSGKVDCSPMTVQAGEDWVFLEKPFKAAALIDCVHAELEQPNVSEAVIQTMIDAQAKAR